MKTLFKASRLPFLVLTPACVLLGAGIAIHDGAAPGALHLALALLGALCAHVAVNALNEYEDFRSGLDMRTERTPFSGGSGALPGDPGSAGAVRLLGLGALAACFAVGLYFAVSGYAYIVPLGLLGMLLIVLYTPVINRQPWLCLVAPGLGFGPLMVGGSYYVFSGTVTPGMLLLSMVPFFLVNNLLLVNQLPDMDADQTVGRHHFPIAYGRARSAGLYALFAALAFACVLLAYLWGQLDAHDWFVLGPLALAVPVSRGLAVAAGQDRPPAMGVMAANVLIAVGTPALLGMSYLA